MRNNKTVFFSASFVKITHWLYFNKNNKKEKKELDKRTYCIYNVWRLCINYQT